MKLRYLIYLDEGVFILKMLEGDVVALALRHDCGMTLRSPSNKIPREWSQSDRHVTVLTILCVDLSSETLASCDFILLSNIMKQLTQSLHIFERGIRCL